MTLPEGSKGGVEIYQFNSKVNLSVATGSFWPLSTLESIRQFQAVGLGQIELTHQIHDFLLDLRHNLRAPIERPIQAMVDEGKLIVSSIHAPHIITEHGFSTRARLDYLMQTLSLCRRLGGKIVVVHPSHLFTSYERSLDYLTDKSVRVWEALLPGMHDLLDTAHTEGVMLSLENVMIWEKDGPYFNDPANLSRFLKDLACPSFGVTLDILHAALMGDVSRFVKEIPDAINNLHLADYQPPDHRVVPGRGSLNWQYLLPRLKGLPNLESAAIELTGASLDDLIQTIHCITSIK